MIPFSNRDAALDRLVTDLVGPSDPYETLAPSDPWRRIYPSDVYLTGILFPRGTLAGPVADESLAAEGAGGTDEDTVADETPATSSIRPSVAGCSFAATCPDGAPEVVFTVTCGTYHAEEIEVQVPKPTRSSGNAAASKEENREMTGEASPDTSFANSNPKPPAEDPALNSTDKPLRPEDTVARKVTVWRRTDHCHRLPSVTLDFAHSSIKPDDVGLPGLSIHIRVAPWTSGLLVTATLVNEFETGKEDDRFVAEHRSFFQTRLEVTPVGNTRFPARPSWRPATDEDSRMAALLYRDAREFAVGHTCSAEWAVDEAGMHALFVATTWIPTAIVPNTSTKGDPVFECLTADEGLRPLSAEWLASTAGESLGRALDLVPAAYNRWIADERGRIGALPDRHRPQATKHLDQCSHVSGRISDAIKLLGSDRNVNAAFRLANRAMLIQRKWLNPSETDLVWRPFQIAFILLALPSVSGKDVADRKVMDLLWFPTGGGKTEAYLGLIAFLLFYRRLSNRGADERGAGVATLMRYTLRLLTTQQFQRAAALICACEYLHRNSALPESLRNALGDKAFSLGLWVGQDAVPNKVESALQALQQNSPNTPAQLERCPCCWKKLKWYGSQDKRSLLVRCENAECDIGATLPTLPIWTVDEDVYREAPSLVIGTVDKFAQIVRRPESAALFGLGTPFNAPDLIVQDELHLISGPLGTMTGIYETAIDQLCTRNGVGPKIIGSTATIRRAEEQIRALFDRDTRQFPPPGIDARNSCFAVQDDNRQRERLYAGVTTAGRSAKFALQAVSASLLQTSQPLATNAERDAFWTLVVYFNALRELGGAWVMTQDDVPATVGDYALRRGEVPRKIQIVEEMTSRVTQLRIREMLDELKLKADAPGAIDVLLASNMISVGVDIPRLGLMVVNGQPKTIAEYIQATSRVGRGDVPGLIVGVYNNNKARDRSHFESFRTWHATLYREVESTSVTPFASRARDRALHAALVALVRHLATGMLDSPRWTPAAEVASAKFVKAILERVNRVDPDELGGTTKQLAGIVDEWRHRAIVKFYWNDRALKTSLLLSAERAAALRAVGRLPGAAWPTPNSMRSVEPGTPFVLVGRLKADQQAAASKEAGDVE